MTCILKGSCWRYRLRGQSLFIIGNEKGKYSTSSSSGELHHKLPPFPLKKKHHCNLHPSRVCACRLQSSRLTWISVWWLSSVTGKQCDTDLKGTRAHTHTLTSYLSTVTSIFRQPREPCNQELVSCQDVYPRQSRFPLQGNHKLFNPGCKIKHLQGMEVVWTDCDMETKFSTTPVDRFKSRDKRFNHALEHVAFLVAC